VVSSADSQKGRCIKVVQAAQTKGNRCTESRRNCFICCAKTKTNYYRNYTESQNDYM